MSDSVRRFASLPKGEQKEILQKLLNEARSRLERCRRANILQVLFSEFWLFRVESKLDRIMGLEPRLKIKDYSVFRWPRIAKFKTALTRGVPWLEMVSNEMEEKLKQLYD